MVNWASISCSIYRGGTSKGIFIQGSDLPQNETERFRTLLSIFGSPDPIQIDGLGGGTPTTSKLAIIDRSSRSDADVDYTFGQVSVERSFIDFKPNCGNISSAVGPFALEHGLVSAQHDEEALVRIFNTNTNTIIHARFAIANGHFVPDGNTVISGVPGSGSAIYLDFFNATGGVTGRVFPTGSVADTVVLSDGRVIRVTVIDAGNLMVLVDADDLGVSGTEIELPDPVGQTLEEIRQRVGRQLGLYSSGEVVAASSHALPKIAWVQHPLDYQDVDGKKISAETIGIVARVLTMGKLHMAYAVTGGIALTVAAHIPGTIPYGKVSARTQTDQLLRIGHPSGVLEVGADVAKDKFGHWTARRVTLVRTARPIMDGQVWVRGVSEM